MDIINVMFNSDLPFIGIGQFKKKLYFMQDLSRQNKL